MWLLLESALALDGKLSGHDVLDSRSSAIQLSLWSPGEEVGGVIPESFLLKKRCVQTWSKRCTNHVCKPYGLMALVFLPENLNSLVPWLASPNVDFLMFILNVNRF